MNQSMIGTSNKIDFHATTSFREAFPQAQNAALSNTNGLRPVKLNMNTMGGNQIQVVDYEQKIEAARDDLFIETLIENQTVSGMGNRFMSPAVRLS